MAASTATDDDDDDDNSNSDHDERNQWRAAVATFSSSQITILSNSRWGTTQRYHRDPETTASSTSDLLLPSTLGHQESLVDR